MSQKWYQKASVQSAIIGGVFLLIASVVGALLTIHSSNRKDKLSIDSSQPSKSDSVKSSFDYQTSKGKPSRNESVGLDIIKPPTLEKARLIVEVSREIGNAEIYIDDRFICSASLCTTYIAQGTYTLTARYFDKSHRGFKFSQKLNIPEDKIIRILAHRFSPE